MQKIVLVIDDDDVLREAVAKGLRQNGFEVLTASSATQADDVLGRIIVDAVVLDRMMPGRDGLSALAEWRRAGNKTPVLLLTALSGPENTIDGLQGGADDYLAKPFQLKELVLRLQNIMQRNAKDTPALPKGLQFVDSEFFANGKLLALSGVEKKLLLGLISPVGNVVPSAPMVAKRLRQKLQDNLNNIDVLTIRTKGYKIVTKA